MNESLFAQQMNAGDVNIRLERVTDPATIEFSDLLAGYGLTQHVGNSTEPPILARP